MKKKAKKINELNFESVSQIRIRFSRGGGGVEGEGGFPESKKCCRPRGKIARVEKLALSPPLGRPYHPEANQSENDYVLRACTAL